MRVALFGGSFNPPHTGHLLAMAYVLGSARVDRLLMVPCFQHRFEKRLAPFAHRMAMAQLAAAPLRNIEVSDVEQRLGGESRTLATVKALLIEDPARQIVVVIGSDLLAERDRWYGYDELAALVEFFVVARSGSPVVDAATSAVQIPDVSSTEIRARLAAAQSIAGLVPAAVADYIAEHRMYEREPDATRTKDSESDEPGP